LKLCRRGVIHVGANSGNERDVYSNNRLDVAWIEPLPDAFAELQRNIEAYPGQRALHGLITDRDGDTVTLHVSNNQGLSSSIFDLALHRDIWPDVQFVTSIAMHSTTLPTALRNAGIDPRGYDALVIDTQGSELLVLEGAEPILSHFSYIKTEAADFEIYKGCCTADQLVAFLEPRGFRLIETHPFARREGGGECFDLVFARV